MLSNGRSREYPRRPSAERWTQLCGSGRLYRSGSRVRRRFRARIAVDRNARSAIDPLLRHQEMGRDILLAVNGEGLRPSGSRAEPDYDGASHKRKIAGLGDIRFNALLHLNSPKRHSLHSLSFSSSSKSKRASAVSSAADPSLYFDSPSISTVAMSFTGPNPWSSFAPSR